MADTSIGTPQQPPDPDDTPALHRVIPLGIQHVLAMFVSNVTPAIIIAGAAGESVEALPTLFHTFIGNILNLLLPEELSDEAPEEVSGGMAGHAKDELVKEGRV